MLPTVGRVVHFYEKGSTEPLPAIVARVWFNTCVNLAIFDADGNSVVDPPTSVQYHENPINARGMASPMRCWTWPPRA